MFPEAKPRVTLRVDTQMSAYDYIAKRYKFAAVSKVHDLIRCESKVRRCFPGELVSFVCPKELVSFNP